MEDPKRLHLWAVLLLLLLCCFSYRVTAETNPGDLAILNDFKKGLENPELLKWPSGGADPCGDKWNHVFCAGSRVSQIQVQNLSLRGPLPENFNKLTELTNIGLQRNSFNGKLPSFSGLSKLVYAYLDYNEFDTIPADFFSDLDSLQYISLDYNPLNQSSGWEFPKDIQSLTTLKNLSMNQCNLVGGIPDFVGGMGSLENLLLSYNNLSGPIPPSFSGLNLKTLWLNNQGGTGFTGPIDAIAAVVSLQQLWLHGNSFTGSIPDGIVNCMALSDMSLNNNQFVGLIPANITVMESLATLKLDNNQLMGSIPDLKINTFTYSGNLFCQSKPGIPCSPEVSALLDFLKDVKYPPNIVSSWSGNDPCSWIGVSCSKNSVSSLILQNRKLNGTISPSLGELKSLVNIKLGGNSLSGMIPGSLTGLKSLKMLNLTANNLKPPLPKFDSSVTVLTDDNPLLNPNPSAPPTSHDDSPPSSDESPSSPGKAPPSSDNSTPSNSRSPPSNHSTLSRTSGWSTMSKIFIGALIPLVALIFIVLCVLVFRQQKKKNNTVVTPDSVVVHPQNLSDPDNIVKISAAANNINKSMTSSNSQCGNSGATGETHVIEAGNMIVSVQVLRNVTHNFAPENELGRGGFGAVYKGVFDDGTIVAVKRMESAMVSNKALDEFQSEIAVLSKVRHRHLVSLLGYSAEGSERLLVYEYMPQGALSQHLFQWEDLKLEPLTWKKRLIIALDVARGVEYLHNLAHQKFIHRDLKSSNILLGEDFRAKVSDFGLVKLAPDGKTSVVTRLAGTFGYLAPEYAVTGKITTKADVFSYGVVLMELVTGLTALDENRPEETRYLASWFWQVKSSKDKLMSAIDRALNVDDETFESISIIAELAGHCTARQPHQRPDMGHVVNVLGPLVEKWKPVNEDDDECSGIDLHQPLLQMVEGWQDADRTDGSGTMSLDDSKGSIPSRPTGFAESFTSADAR
ncbi:putative receptor protein kinase TMK1 [Acorus gramineus]|uniref:non-specific serine/threonine protein kinase n=1 Tax=Acorus gramineus TaxID=55184 RepID=A0AAV9AG74_ACOGR|nr:putative receptor protein kinase TMK1 [Acorus gramineus]